MIKVADKTSLLRHTNLGPSTHSRDRRNLIHPAKAVEHFLADEALRPEARMGAEVIQAVIRDLSPAAEPAA